MIEQINNPQPLVTEYRCRQSASPVARRLGQAASDVDVVIAAIPSAALRAARLQIVGGGQGSVSTREILAALTGLAAEITNGTFQIDARAVPLTGIEAAWKESAPAGWATDESTCTPDSGRLERSDLRFL